MAGVTSVKKSTLAQQDLLAELRLFIAGATQSLKIHPLELARKALSLMKTLPAARDAVLEYFCTIFYSAVSNFVKHLKAGTNNKSNENETLNQDETVISEIHTVLCNFVNSNPEAWAPIISTWSLELLGELSTKYAGQAHPHPGDSDALNESMQIWMSCHATKTLIDINTQCLSCLMHSNADASINALLETSVNHSPHFDWVVAHVGSCFPHTVITRVLSCGLRDFSQNKDDTIAAKMNSVVGILGHLAGSHFADIRNSLLELFQWSLQTGDRKQERIATVPYLLKLASLSPTLLRALNTDVLQSVNSEIIGKLVENGPVWATFFQGRQPLLDLTVHLMLNSEQGADKFISLLLETAAHPNKNVKITALEILEILLKDIDLLVRLKGAPVPFLTCIQQKLTSLQPLLLSDDPLCLKTGVRLLTFLGYLNASMLPGALSHVIMKPMSDMQLAAVVEITHCQQDQDCFAQAVMFSLRSCFEQGGGKSTHLWVNLEKLLKDEKSKRLAISGLWPNLEAIAESLCECHSYNVLITIATVLELVFENSQETLSTQTVIWLTHASVKFFYTCLSLQAGSYERSKSIKIVGKLLKKLASTSNVARSLAFRELCETALFHPPSYLFGATGQTFSEITNTPSLSLIKENKKQGTSSMLAQRHSSVFHAGVIGSGLRTEPQVPEIMPEQTASNTQCLIAMLRAICLSENIQTSLDAVISLALLLVELISPDVMYNGLPWPEEDFCKVTVERDLCIRRLFNSLPLLWILLKFIASHRPALCYCSVLLRAVTATLIGQWSTAGQQRQQPGEDKQLVQTTVTLLQVMALGQLLPPPLSCLSDVIPHLPPFQIVMILRDCVWNYMRDHVPSPALFARDSSGVMWRDPALAKPAKQYTETLRLTLLKNIATFGNLYSLLFLNATSDS